MLANQDIVYFGNDFWNHNRTSSHHIAQELSKRNRLLYVQSAGLRAPTLTRYDLARLWGRITRITTRISKVNPNLYVVSPLIVPYHTSALVRHTNRLLLRWVLRARCRELGFGSPILWMTNPHMVGAVGGLGEKLVVYYCTDEYAAMPGVSAKGVRILDQEMTRCAHIVFTASERVYQKKREQSAEIYLSPHGVSVEHFGQVLSEQLPIPWDIKEIPRPIIGYFGLIERWTDLELLRRLATDRPAWSFVMIGRIAANTKALDGLRNVHFLGSKDFEVLPNYGQCFDVAILPYVRNEQVLSANPLKLREYLAMGKAVVSLRTPETAKFADVVYLADNPQEFLAAIERALREDSAARKRARVARVEDMSWGVRAAEVCARVEAVMKRREREHHAMGPECINGRQGVPERAGTGGMREGGIGGHSCG